MNKEDESNDPRPFTKVEIFERNFQTLTDTGTPISLISDEVASFLFAQGVKFQKERYNMKLENGMSIPITGIYKFYCTINGKEREVKMANLPFLITPLVLGMDLIMLLDLITIKSQWENLIVSYRTLDCISSRSVLGSSLENEE